MYSVCVYLVGYCFTTSFQLFSVITVGFGINLPGAMVDDSARYVVIGYAVVFILVQVILQAYNSLRKKGERFGSLQLHCYSKSV